MNKIVTIQNPNTKQTSAVLVGETLDSMVIIMSKPDMNRRLGWINCLHDEILNTDHTVDATVQKDISTVEAKHHKLWKEDKKSYNMDAYLLDVMRELKLEIDIHFAVSNEVNELMEEVGISEGHVSFVDLTKNVLNGRMMSSLKDAIKANEIDELVFKFEATDYIGWESVGYCIYNLSNDQMRCYISPVEFFETIEHKRYGYCGHVYAHNCMTERDVLNESALSGIRKAVKNRIVEFDDKESAAKRINAAFNL